MYVLVGSLQKRKSIMFYTQKISFLDWCRDPEALLWESIKKSYIVAIEMPLKLM